MKKIVVAVDKFKGTLGSAEICQIVKKQIETKLPKTEVVAVAVSDGGEGFVDAFLSARQGQRIIVDVHNPFFEITSACFALLDDGTAIIEVSQACGLKLVEGRADTKNATSFGVGELILHAQKRNAKKIVLGLGGTSTTDGGAGMLCALGARFFDKHSQQFVPTGKNLQDIVYLDTSQMTVPNAQIVCLTDSLNPLYGKLGSAFVYAKQKGASDSEIQMLDDGLINFSHVVSQVTQTDLSQTAGTGAAGGLGFAVVSLLNGKIEWGIEQILKIVDFEKMLDGADLVITGEGKFDQQSLLGKAVAGIAKVAQKQNVPVALIAGTIVDVHQDELKNCGIEYSFETNVTGQTDFEKIKLSAKTDLQNAVDRLIDTIAC